MAPKKKETVAAAAPKDTKENNKAKASLTGKKTSRAEEKEVEEKNAKPAPKKATGKKAAASKKEKEEDEKDLKDDSEAATTPTSSPTSPPAAKKLRRESSTGGDSSLMPSTGDLDNLTQEECEKDTVPFDYDDALAKNNSKVFPPSDHYKVISWNVAGLRALVKAGYEKSELKTLIEEEQPDILCLQETKLSNAKEALTTAPIKGYAFVESLSTAKLGYAGTRTYLRDGVFDLEKSKHFMGLDLTKNPTVADDEGRIVTSFLFPNNNNKNNNKATETAAPLTIVNTYIPNSGMKLERLDFRVADYDKLMRKFLSSDVPTMESKVFGTKPSDLLSSNHMIWLGDLNVAERNYDRFHNGNYKKMQKSPGFTPPERSSFRETLKTANLVDSFRHFFPNSRGAYTFYSRMFNQRAAGNGWRLDYFVVSKAMMNSGRVVGTAILNKYKGSDHVPSVLYIKKKQ